MVAGFSDEGCKGSAADDGVEDERRQLLKGSVSKREDFLSCHLRGGEVILFNFVDITKSLSLVLGLGLEGRV